MCLVIVKKINCFLEYMKYVLQEVMDIKISKIEIGFLLNFFLHTTSNKI